MSKRIARVNKHIQRVFGAILQREADLPPGVLVTIARVETSPKLTRTTIYLYVNPPERSAAVLELLTPQLYDLQGAFNHALDRKPLPRLRLRIDYGADHAQAIDDTLRRLDRD